MSSQKDAIEIAQDVAITLMLETWRLWQALGELESQFNTIALRYPIKKMKDALESSGCKFIDLTGQSYDTGMAADVITTEEDSLIKSGDIIIKEMVSPIILWNDMLLSHGQVVLAKGITDDKGTNKEQPS